MNFVEVLHQAPHEWSATFGVRHVVDVPPFVADRPQLKALFHERLAATGIDPKRPPEIIAKRPIVTPESLEKKEAQLYAEIRDKDDEILRFLTKAPNVSGRILDALVTKYPRVADASYYLDDDGNYCGDREPEHGGTLISLGSAYKEQIRAHSKNCFDPFGRGHDILHQMPDGRYVLLSLCRFLFHRWAEQKHVYTFLLKNFDAVVCVQRESLSGATRKRPAPRTNKKKSKRTRAADPQ